MAKNCFPGYYVSDLDSYYSFFLPGHRPLGGLYLNKAWAQMTAFSKIDTSHKGQGSNFNGKLLLLIPCVIEWITPRTEL